MSGILNTVMILGAMGVGLYLVMHRCDLLGFCGDIFGSAAAATTPPAESTVATEADNTKKQKCGCCTCAQVGVKEINCAVSDGSVRNFTGGLSLDAQCKACAADPNICKDADAKAKEQEKATKAAITAKDAAQNVKGNKIITTTAIDKKGTKASFPVQCKSGFHLNANNVCVADGSNSKAKLSPNASIGCTGTAGLKDCHTPKPGEPNAGKLVCRCANFARQSYFADTGHYRAFRNRLSYN